MNHVFPKTYDPLGVEDAITDRWEKSGATNPDNLDLPADAENFSIVLPPPNVTGTLHLGHAMYVIQDIMVRYARMLGKRTLWLPGTDHAAIATQNRVEKEIFQKEGKTRHDIGREELVRRIEVFVEQSKSTIKHQLRKMGFSLDWSRDRFTLDPEISRAVRKLFIDMYNDGLIYRGNRIVNWCPRCQSTLADDEVEYKEQQTPFYYFKYGPFVIGTVRPETKIGDHVVIVHPDDERYKEFHHQKFTVPWIDGDIEATVIPDEASDPELGSGAMTITPAHSFVDFELAAKYGITAKNIIGKDGRLTSEAGTFAGLTTKEARKKFVEILRDKGLLDHVDENYMNKLSVCYRCGTAIEPLVSRQWFVNVSTSAVVWNGKTQSLKETALEVVESREIEIIPDRFRKTYTQWIENLHDWCISRQLWYGHRIPVWYCKDCHDDPATYERGEYWVVSEEPVTICPRCNSSNTYQDYDVLDTWFSSGMWTFTTLGWPKDTEDFRRFHPTSVLETGYDILFFWVARMILLTTYATKQVPFKTVYLHGLVRDKQGAKMSKSRGNGIDPLEVSAKYGTDAVRLSLVAGTAPGNDTRLYEEKIAGFRNFVNKLWNISRFVLTCVETPRLVTEPPKDLATDADVWILSRLGVTIRGVTDCMNAHQYGRAVTILQDFTWSDFADWYLEISKIEGEKDEVLLYVLQTILKLWHPFTPFITEHVYSHLTSDLLMTARWPDVTLRADSPEEVAVLGRIQAMRDAVTEIRNIRGEYNIPYTTALEVSGKVSHPELIERMARVTFISKLSGVAIGRTVKIGVEGVIDPSRERERIRQEIQKLRVHIKTLENKLRNVAFSEHAPKEIIAKEKEKLESATSRVRILEEQHQQLAQQAADH